MAKSQITNSFSETQELGQNFALQILSGQAREKAVVLALQGDLGAGKTTFLQGFAKGLGIKENVLSPTFIIMKKFKFPHSSSRIQNTEYKSFYHFDLYRLNDAKEILDLGFAQIISDPKNIVAIEWPEKIYTLLPETATVIKFDHKEENIRELTIYS